MLMPGITAHFRQLRHELGHLPHLPCFCRRCVQVPFAPRTLIIQMPDRLSISRGGNCCHHVCVGRMMSSWCRMQPPATSTQVMNRMTPSSPPHPVPRYSLRTLLTAVTLICVWFGACHACGVHWAMLPVDFLVIGWALASSSEAATCFGRPVHRLTGGEFAVLCTICTTLHAYFLPSGQ